MEFEIVLTNQSSMKKLFIIILTAVSVAVSASPSEKRAARQKVVKEAVESKRFAIELNQLYLSRYGVVNLHSGSNYIIIDDNKAYVSAAYLGRQHGLYPVAGIRLTGEPSVYKLKKNESRKNYRIEMEVNAGNDVFHITMVISDNGHCTTIISGAKMDSTKYSGNLKPIETGKKKKKIREPDAIRI
jgi:hypothetical protein